jgi:hypothetical protein
LQQSCARRFEQRDAADLAALRAALLRSRNDEGRAIFLELDPFPGQRNQFALAEPLVHGNDERRALLIAEIEGEKGSEERHNTAGALGEQWPVEQVWKLRKRG